MQAEARSSKHNIQPLPVSGISVAHQRQVYCMCTEVSTCCAVQLTVCWSFEVFKCKEIN